MNSVIHTIINQLNPALIESELDKIRDIRLDMRDIRFSIDSLRGELNVWEKLNPFSQSDEKRELKLLKDEMSFYKGELKTIKERLRVEIRSIIESSTPLRMKATVSSMEDSLETILRRLKRSKSKQASSIRRIPEMQTLSGQVRELDIMIEQEFGFERGIFQEHEMVESVLQTLLDGRNA